MLVDGWVDVHAHFSPPVTDEQSDLRWAQRQASQSWQGPKPAEWSLEATLDYMDRIGIAMQLLSNIPKSFGELLDSNDFGAALVTKHPDRFGLLAALPTDDPDAAVGEIKRSASELQADGFAMTCCYNDVYLGDSSLEPIWRELNRRRSVVFLHPNAVAPGTFGRPTPLLDVAFETTRTVVDMLFRGVFRRYPAITFVLAHCGGALPALSGRLFLLGTEPWVSNPEAITEEEMRAQLSALFLDTAAAGSAALLAPALTMTTCEHLVFGSDCGVPCTREQSSIADLRGLLEYRGLARSQIEQIGHRARSLFPAAAQRMCSTTSPASPIVAATTMK